MPGVLLYCSAHRADREDNWLGSYSVNWHVRHLKGTLSGSYSIVSSHSLYCSASNAGMWGREAMVMAPPPTGDSAVSPCFYGCPAFLHRHFQPQPPPLHPLDLSLHSQQQPSPWDCTTIPKLQLPVAVHSTFLPGIGMAAARTV